ncbi:hypothetical protein Rhal01_03760 [Rubritalea halochordaticola]|uniref:Ankyrin repeat domain-containing protein n=1 Tax=Rubritalea halochordaticola TaxID=714537 RepID=A0ABP9V4G4_9BACT
MKKYLRASFGDFEQQDLDELQDLCGELPDSFTEFLWEQNGGVGDLKFTGTSVLIYGLGDSPSDLRTIYRETKDEMPDRMMKIGDFSEDRSLLLNCDNGEIFIDGSVVAKSIKDYISEHLTSYEIPGGVENEIVFSITNRRNKRLRELLQSAFNQPSYRTENGLSLVQMALIARNYEAIAILAEFNYDFSGSLFYLFEKLKVNFIFLNALLEGNVNLDEVNQDGKTIFEIDHSWVEDLKKMCRERGLL